MMFAGTGVWKSKRGAALLGCRCVFINDEQYGYNVRDELISADEASYAYDDIGIYAPTSVSEVGNRTIAEGKTYAANNLNQYTAIDDFTPQYDADGNQTLIKTETGVWSVVYNAENRPVRWTQGDTVISMDFDRMGRRVDYRETRAGQVVTHFRFVYDNFLCVQRLNAANGNAVRSEFVWDPTEPIATRPLVMRAKNWGLNLFYTHDGNKNVAEVFYHAPQNGIAAHYDYAPFGAVTRTSSATRVTTATLSPKTPSASPPNTTTTPSPSSTTTTGITKFTLEDGYISGEIYIDHAMIEAFFNESAVISSMVYNRSNQMEVYGDGIEYEYFNVDYLSSDQDSSTVEKPLSVEYASHIQNIGWQDYMSEGIISGTTGRGLRLEGIRIRLNQAAEGSISYRAYVQNI